MIEADEELGQWAGKEPSGAGSPAGRPRPLLVGEVTPRKGEPLDPTVPNGSGARLCAILGLSAEEFLGKFDRVNLCSGTKWDALEAERAALTVRSATKFQNWRVTVLLGRKVASAMGLGGLQYFSDLSVGLTGRIVLLPHPSGRCRVWNDRGSAARARAAIIRAGVDLGGGPGNSLPRRPAGKDGSKKAAPAARRSSTRVYGRGGDGLRSR